MSSHDGPLLDVRSATGVHGAVDFNIISSLKAT